MAEVQASSRFEPLCDAAGLAPEAKELFRSDLLPRDYLAELQEAKLTTDALRWLAHLLPKREGVWWSWHSVRAGLGQPVEPKAQAALDATEAWLKQPADDELRRAALRAAEDVGFGHPAGCAALAAFLAHGSLAPPNVPPVPPGAYLTAQAVAGSILLASVVRQPEAAAAKQESFLKKGLEIADRIQLWKRLEGGPLFLDRTTEVKNVPARS